MGVAMWMKWKWDTARISLQPGPEAPHIMTRACKTHKYMGNICSNIFASFVHNWRIPEPFYLALYLYRRDQAVFPGFRYRTRINIRCSELDYHETSHWLALLRLFCRWMPSFLTTITPSLGRMTWITKFLMLLTRDQIFTKTSSLFPQGKPWLAQNW